MRFLYIDRILEAERGKRIRAIKTFPLSEAFLQGHYSRKPIIPGAIILEAMAQITGWLIIYTYDFEKSCVISLAQDVELPAGLTPGTTLELHGEILDTGEKGSLARAHATLDGEVVARCGRFIYPHFRNERPEALREEFRSYGWLYGREA
ncbi:MAG: 3-hydroxyacyl-[acyl-carrier-protein] dehydratase FabZ [bacterium]|nr:3-hydroxyacyl-[acyl-carrier-protein] dehydratase FabZ [bacterium]